ncbi:DUF4256 domain-containing protein [Patescibacteria group bacterium]
MASTDSQGARIEEIDVLSTSIEEVAKIISDPVKMELARLVLSIEGEAVEVSDFLRSKRSEVFVFIERVLKATGMEGIFSIPEADEQNGVDVELSEADVNKELTPEAAELTLGILEARFMDNNYLHEGCDWSRVKMALEASPESLWSVAQMEAQGHMPDVYNYDNNGFDIGTCSEDIPASAKNCVYDAEVAQLWREKDPDRKFNRSAVEMAEAMGIKLMSPEQYKYILQTKGDFDKQTWSWLLTEEATRITGYAFLGARCDYIVNLNLNFVHSHNTDGGWRGSLRVPWI